MTPGCASRVHCAKSAVQRLSARLRDRFVACSGSGQTEGHSQENILLSRAAAAEAQCALGLPQHRNIQRRHGLLLHWEAESRPVYRLLGEPRAHQGNAISFDTKLNSANTKVVSWFPDVTYHPNFSGQVFKKAYFSWSFSQYWRVQTQFHRRASTALQGTLLKSHSSFAHFCDAYLSTQL